MNQYKISRTNKTLSLHLTERSDAAILEFRGDGRGTSIKEWKILAKTLKQLKRVKKFEIWNEKNTKIESWNLLAGNDEGIKALFENVHRLSSLESIILNFYENKNVTDETLKKLSESLKRCSSLQYININFGFCNKITDRGLEALGKALKGLNSLQSLNLKVNDCKKITGKGLVGLSTGFKRLDSLRNMDLDFNNCPHITDYGLGCIWTSLNKLGSLRSLSLNFSNCKEITNEGFNNIEESLAGLNSLNCINLKFANCREITNPGLKALNEALTNLRSLKSMTLDFSNCSKITDEALSHLSFRLAKIDSLHSLSLTFSNCSQITTRSLNILTYILNRKAKSFQSMHLDFQGIKKIDWCHYYLSELCMGINSPSSLDFNYYSYSNFHGPTLLDWHWRCYFDNQLNPLKSTSQEPSVCDEIEEQASNASNQDYEDEISYYSQSTNRDLSQSANNCDLIQEEYSWQHSGDPENSINLDSQIFLNAPGFADPNEFYEDSSQSINRESSSYDRIQDEDSRQNNGYPHNSPSRDHPILSHVLQFTDPNKDYEYEIFDDSQSINRDLSRFDRIREEDSRQHNGNPPNSLNRNSLSFGDIRNQEFNSFNEEYETPDSFPSINREFSKYDRVKEKDSNQHNEHPPNSLLSTNLGSFDFDETTDQDPKILDESLGTLKSLQSTNDSFERHGTTDEDSNQQSKNLPNSLSSMNGNPLSYDREFAKVINLIQNPMSLPLTESHGKWACGFGRRDLPLDDILDFLRIPKRQPFQPITTVLPAFCPSLVIAMG